MKLVTFKLVHKCGNVAIYHYWTENNEKEKPEDHGVISFDKEKMVYKIIKMASSDFQYTVSIEDQREIREYANRGKIACGDPPLTEEEWPTPKEEWVITTYAGHAFKRIKEALIDEKRLPIHGESRWY